MNLTKKKYEILTSHKNCIASIKHNVYVTLFLTTKIYLQVAYFHEKPVANVTISNVNYDLAREITDKISAPIYTTFVTNKGHIEQCGSRDVNVVNTEESTITSKLGIEIGVSVKLEAGVPFLWESETTISPKVSAERSWGKKKSEQIRDAVKADICVPPR